jgi:hypothetical protein
MSGGRRRINKPINKYKKFILITGNEYIAQLESKALERLRPKKPNKKGKKWR